MLLVSLVGVGVLVGAEQPERTLSELHQEKISLLESLLEYATTQSEVGRLDTVAVFKAHSRLLKAKFAATQEREERLELLKEHVRLFDRWERLLENRLKVGASATMKDVLEVRVRRVDVEIALKKEESR